MNLNELLCRDIPCSCGQTHRANVEAVYIESGAIARLPGELQKRGYARPLLVCDENTLPAAGRRAQAALSQAGCAYRTFTYPQADLAADDAAQAQLFEQVLDADVLVAVGAGTLGDLCKFVSFRRGLPCFTVATAPSMDGFASTVAAMITGSMKVTYETHTPQVILADVDVLKAAPMEMIAAGVGDILGKYTCLCDWQIAHVVTGEAYCDKIAGMIRDCIRRVVAGLPALPGRGPEAVRDLCEALVLSGVAMAYAGNSRPASGSEHHLSHFFELRFLQQGRPPVLHGIKVGVGTVIVLRAYERLRDARPDFEGARRAAAAFDEEAWQARMRAAYGAGAKDVLELEARSHKNAPANVIERLLALENRWPEVEALIAALPTPAEVHAQLSAVGAPSEPAQLGIDGDLLAEGILCAKELRVRYGLWQMLFDLGMLDETAQALR